ncbi:MAG: formylglycine-generating enzyme family protein [Gemmatimonadota bacterium]|nr:formylglycine-generating enzyme family protein [Gemmatimonadota bacterium]
MMLLSAIVLGSVTATPGHAQAGGPPARGAPQATARMAPLPTFRADAWGLPDEPQLGFVEISGGPFLMGSDPRLDPESFENEHWPGDGTMGTVDLPTYYISRYEVTIGQFRAFVEATGRTVDPQALLAPDSYPVIFVSWPDAVAYTRWLEGEMKKSATTPPALREMLNTGWRVTLPTEAEWEKAARGTDGRIFPWGDEEIAGPANIAGRSLTPVGYFDCSAVCANGLEDMSGNVWEWTRTPFSGTGYGGVTTAPDLEADALWVMRGGSYADALNLNRVAVRGGADPGARRGFIGFRLAITRD